MNTENKWYLFCPKCSYRQADGVAMTPICPDCGERLKLDDGTTFQGAPITWDYFDYEAIASERKQ